ncbi:unnamed protein product [Blepharisma stoltei]|uniref:Dickkopf N-terminal cysteine-rich domain-containing protein n=1 Tax=Blepharisma stoltei TaxID=1481888 RepID=A0AAU9KIK3_9CILI|nr:unnamed protein product [Blepharisma stoltei]
MSLDHISKTLLLLISLELFSCFKIDTEVNQSTDIILEEAPEIVNLPACPIYACKPDNVPFANDTCVFYDSKTNTNLCSPCKDSSTYCEFNFNSNFSCIPIVEYEHGESNPGEKCRTLSDCDDAFVLSCTDGVCQGTVAGKSCDSATFCNPGLGCISGTCQPLTKSGSKGCLSDFDCENGAGCNITNALDFSSNLCIEYGSVVAHEIISTCINSVNNLCEYTYCAPYKGLFACTSQLKTVGNIPAACAAENAQCTSTSDDFFDPPFSFSQPGCQCAYTETGTELYCDLFNGDAQYMAYYKLLFEWLQTADAKKCNTDRRTASRCIESNWDKKKYDALMYYQANAYYYPIIQNTEPCVLNSFLDQFYGMHRRAYNQDNDSSANILILSIFIIWLN